MIFLRQNEGISRNETGLIETIMKEEQLGWLGYRHGLKAGQNNHAMSWS